MQKKRTNVPWGGAKHLAFKERDWHKEKIVEMVNHIENERFLKAIYISVSEYLKENEPD